MDRKTQNCPRRLLPGGGPLTKEPEHAPAFIKAAENGRPPKRRKPEAATRMPTTSQVPETSKGERRRLMAPSKSK